MARSLSDYAARVDRDTPSERDRYIDLLRGVAILAVVLGHWLAVAVVPDDGRIDGTSVLELADWTHWFTWLFQVMPIFFLVGGYANATSWRRHRDAGGTWPAWLHRRSVRLLRPTAAFAAASVAVVIGAHLAGADPGLLDDAGWVAGIALWFLAIYIAVAGATPLSYYLHERSRLGTLLALAAVLVPLDVARIVMVEPAWAAPNFLIGWALIHQVGFWWHDGAVPSGPRTGLLLTGLGAVALLGLTVAGPWPVAMVDVPGEVIHNSSPPSVALLVLVTVQAGLVFSVADAARRWLERPVVWTVVASVNRVVLTLFLWHMAAVVAAVAALHMSGLVPIHEPLTAQWWAWRPVWLLALALLAGVLVAIFSPLEQRSARPLATRQHRPRVAGALAGIGVPLACAGLFQLTLGGLAGDGPLSIPVLGASLLAVGLGATHWAGRFAPQP